MAALTVVSTFSGAHASRLIAGSATIGSAAIGGLETAGAIGGIIGVAAAVLTLTATIAANNRARRKEYAEEIRGAEQRGFDQARRAADARIRNLVDELKEARGQRDFYQQQWAARWGEPPPPPKGTEQ